MRNNQTPKFYGIPKTHKKSTQLPPMRPISKKKVVVFWLVVVELRFSVLLSCGWCVYGLGSHPNQGDPTSGLARGALDPVRARHEIIMPA